MSTNTSFDMFLMAEGSSYFYKLTTLLIFLNKYNHLIINQ